MASVTMSQAPSSYSSSSSSTQSNYSENDITGKFGRIKFTDGPTLIVCDIDSEGCPNPMKRPTEQSTKSTVPTIGQINGNAKLTSSPSTQSMKETIERSPSTSSLSVPSVDVDEKRPPLPDENMMID